MIHSFFRSNLQNPAFSFCCNKRACQLLTPSLFESPQIELSLMRRQSLLAMRLSINAHNNARQQPNKKRLFGSFASKAFVATATVCTSYAAYCFVTALMLSSIASVNADADREFQAVKKKDDTYGIEYVGLDSYTGAHADRRTGIATEEVKATSAAIVLKALEAAGLDDTGIVKGITALDGGDMTLDSNYAHRIGFGTCPLYGCPFLPLDVHHDEAVKAQLGKLRNAALKDDGKELKSAGSDKAATLTLIGYKGGKLEHQINQDRAIALSPYSYYNINSSSCKVRSGDSLTRRPVAKLIGVFDGHAKYGEKVSEYVVKTLPALLGSKLIKYDAIIPNDDDETDQQYEDLVSQILHETFLELDASSPADPSGGCTASILLQLGTKIYIANAGDSRSFVAVHIIPPSQSADGSIKDANATTRIIFGTREDKPHLSTERIRVEGMGGNVYIPHGFLNNGQGTTRVLYQDPTTGSTSGLAMSRSIGDWDAGEVGVIPDPMIDILDMNEIKRMVLKTLNEACKGETQGAKIDSANGEPSPVNPCVTYTEKNVKIFAVSATDGLLDYLPEQAIVTHVAKGLYDTTKATNEITDVEASHPLLACEDLIYAAAQGWQKDKGGRYRDDIAIAVADLGDE